MFRLFGQDKLFRSKAAVIAAAQAAGEDGYVVVGRNGHARYEYIPAYREQIRAKCPVWVDADGNPHY